jgi:small subunit ribosomal protein S8
MINDHVSDMLARIKNGQRAGHRSVLVTVSNLNKNVLDVLKREGFIEGYENALNEDKKPAIKVELKYFTDGRPVISRARRVSTPGRRQYFKSDKLPHVSSGLGVAIVSTSKGVMTDNEARKSRVGGEVLALIG